MAEESSLDRKLLESDLEVVIAKFEALEKVVVDKNKTFYCDDFTQSRKALGDLRTFQRRWLEMVNGK